MDILHSNIWFYFYFFTILIWFYVYVSLIFIKLVDLEVYKMSSKGGGNNLNIILRKKCNLLLRKIKLFPV